MSIQPQAAAVMNQRFGKDSLIALATVEEGKPFVRAVNAYYEDGSFYIITHALSNKMRQLAANSAASLCGDWFTGEGLGEDMGWLLSGPNQALADKLKNAFAAWYHNGHINENDPNTHILRIRLTHGVLFDQGARYDIDFDESL